MERLTERSKTGTAFFDDDGALIRGAGGAFHKKKDMTANFIHQRFVALDKTIDRLAAYENAMPLERAQELARAEKDGRLVVLDEPRKPLVWGDDRHDTIFCPNCNHDLMGGFPEDEYCEKDMYQCPYCGQAINSGKAMTREEAEAALKKREGEDSEH